MSIIVYSNIDVIDDLAMVAIYIAKMHESIDDKLTIIVTRIMPATLAGYQILTERILFEARNHHQSFTCPFLEVLWGDNGTVRVCVGYPITVIHSVIEIEISNPTSIDTLESYIDPTKIGSYLLSKQTHHATVITKLP